MGRTKKQAMTFEDLNREAELHQSIVSPYQDIIDRKDVEILELKHQIVGYKAVISYLEHQLGLNKSQ